MLQMNQLSASIFYKNILNIGIENQFLDTSQPKVTLLNNDCNPSLNITTIRKNSVLRKFYVTTNHKYKSINKHVSIGKKRQTAPKGVYIQTATIR